MLPPLTLPARAAALALLLAVSLISISPTGAIGAAGQETPPSRIETAPTALPAIDRGTRQLPIEWHAQLEQFRAQREAGSRQPVAGRVLVKFHAGASASMRAAAAQSVGGRLSSRSASALQYDVFEIDEGARPEAVASELASRPDVEYAQADYRVYPRWRPNDPKYVHQWNYPLLNMEAAWEVDRGADDSIIVAVLDTGVAYRAATFEYDVPGFRAGPYIYPSLGRITVPFAPAPDLARDNRFVAPRDFIWNDESPLDVDGHGTHVAGTIGQLSNNGLEGVGMAFNARLMPVKVIAGDWDQILRAPGGGTDDTVARGIRYAVDNGARVLNLSLGREGPSSPVMEEALRYAVSKGAVVTIAAGNSYQEGNPDEVPARYGPSIAGVITVGAVGHEGNRSYYSAVKSYVEVAAPGGDVRANGEDGLIYQQMFDPDAAVLWPIQRTLPPSQYHAPRFDVFAFVGIQGTSMAAPHVAGLAALIMHHGVKDPGAVEQTIKQFALDRGAAGPDPEYGAGLINPPASLRGRGLGLTR